jgi:uncharacterized secreted protein with C-terminal beta-propeller domain
MDFRATSSGLSRPVELGQTPSLQTWDATDKDNLAPSIRLGAGEALYGAVFLPDKAFAVTYQQVDPFHSFSIDPAGNVQEESQFIVSGFNNFLRPVLGASRLIGIGVDDTNGSRLAVSLYDITNLQNPNPLIQRVEVQGGSYGWDWSEAMWDHRAFKIMDNAVSAQAPTGETENGLVLLPFSGYRFENNYWSYGSGVQIFTYSSGT